MILQAIASLVLASGEGPDPVDHVVNHGVYSINGWWIWSAQQGSLVLAAILCVAVLMYAASKIRTGPESQGTNRYVTQNKLAHTIEVICIYLREQTARPILGARSDRFMPFLWTVFFFILLNNLFGMLPIPDIFHLVGGHDVKMLFGGTATQNIAVTGVLALIAALVINIAGIRELGLLGYLKHLTAGTPMALWLLMIPIEIAGTFIKPVALAIRLMANMTAGHILLATLAIFVGNAVGSGNFFLAGTVSIVSIAGMIAVSFLELFVAFLQAFVFMFLTAVFIAQLSHHDDEHEHGHGHDHEHAHA